MIKWYDFKERKPKKGGYYLVYMGDNGHVKDLSILDDLVCVAEFDPHQEDQYQWFSPVYDIIPVLYWAKINLPLGLNVLK